MSTPRTDARLTREEYVGLWEHEIGGMILDAFTSPVTGAALSIKLRQTMTHVRTLLGRQYDGLTPKLPSPSPAPSAAPVNGILVKRA